MKLFTITLLSLLIFNGCNHDHDHSHDTHAHDEHAHNDHDTHKHEEEGIVFSTEQQWEVNIVTQIVKKQKLRPSLLTFGQFELPSNAQQMLTAPVSGIVLPVPNIQVGSQIKAGDILAYITPILGEKEDTATLQFELIRAKANLTLSNSEYKRLLALKEKNAISKKRLLSAKNALSIAKAEVTTIQKRLNQLDPKSKSKSGVALKSHITATVVSLNTISGSYVKEGDRLMQLADNNKLWLNIQVAQADISKVRNPSGVTLHRAQESMMLEENSTSFLYFSDLLNPKTATASLMYTIDNRDYGFKSGERFSLSLYTQEAKEYTSIPKSAIVDDNGLKVVYVQLDDEHFIRRNVETGIIDGESIAILNGLKVGERVVTVGAYRILLAGLSPAQAGHGHSH